MRQGLTFYAELPGRRLRQILGDGLVLLWVVAWVLVGREVHSRASTQGDGAQKLETAGGDFSRSMGDAGSALRRVPVVGDDIQEPFNRASSAGAEVSRAGRDIQVGADQLGQLLGILTAALPILLVVAFWAQARLRYARRVRVARALEDHGGADIQAVRLAAGLDLASLGLRPQTAAPGPSSEPPPSATGGQSVLPPVSAPLPTVNPQTGGTPTTDPQRGRGGQPPGQP